MEFLTILNKEDIHVSLLGNNYQIKMIEGKITYKIILDDEAADELIKDILEIKKNKKNAS